MPLQGTDIPDVDDVVQFMTPEALSVWTQRAGRAGRDRWPSRAILLIEPSVPVESPIDGGRCRTSKPQNRPQSQDLD